MDSDYSENDDDLEEERMIAKLRKQKVNLKRQKKEEEDSDDQEEKQLFKNPLLAFDKKKKGDGDDSSEWSDDDKYEPKMTKEQRRAEKEKDRKLLGKKRKAGIDGDIEDVKQFFDNEAPEEVPVEDLEALQKEKDEASDSEDLPSGYTSMDSDDLAETRALAKKMLRKKFRETTISNSYNRYAFDDNKALPEWFVEDEAKVSVPNYNLS